jgi:hypothetical protein
MTTSSPKNKKTSSVPRRVRRAKKFSTTTTTPWKLEEDVRIQIERQAGRSFRAIAKDLATSALAVKNRYNKLMKMK